MNRYFSTWYSIPSILINILQITTMRLDFWHDQFRGERDTFRSIKFLIKVLACVTKFHIEYPYVSNLI